MTRTIPILAFLLALLAQCITDEREAEWKMHHIDRQYFNHNSLSPGDVNGDGNLDIIFVNGDRSDVSIVWGPDKSEVTDPDKWRDGGIIPSSVNQGHYLYVETYDINQDGALDIIAGGRRHKNGKVNGLIWFEAPLEKTDREDLSKWAMHSVDSTLLSGHGFVIEDLNKDGYPDLIIADADWDTPDNQEKVLWYEHPGPEGVRDPWEKHVILRSQMFFAKPQVGVGDINKDGKTDLAVQVDNYVLYLEQRDNPDDWEVYKINKPEFTRWVPRPTEIVDLNGDGRLDIVGMLIHDWGWTDPNKATVFWMEFTGEKPGTDNWVTHVIKWSDGFFPGRRYQGEKWDHCRFRDIDRDGDLDIIGNCEEYYDENRNTILGVVWFENSLK